MAFFHDPHTRQPFLRAPAATLVLIGILVLAHLLRVLVSPTMSNSIIGRFAFIPALYSHAFLAAHHVDPGTAFDQALPFVSYIFLHADWTHLAINCIWLLPFGSVVARRFGAPLFFLFFLLCGIAGAATHLAFNWGSPGPVIGASAAVSGLMAAAFRMMSVSRAGSPELAPLTSPRVLVWTAVWAGINVIAGVTGLGAGTEVRLVAWQAHLGGYLAGLLLAGPFDSLASLARQRLSRRD
jgi:membrane associated rhomboid family serine protease